MNNDTIDMEHGLDEMDEKKPVLNAVVIGGVLLTFLTILVTFAVPAIKFIFQ